MNRYFPLWEMLLVRIKIFFREPAAIFWIYGLPLLLILGLGIAFRSNKGEVIVVDVVKSTGSSAIAESLNQDTKYKVKVLSAEEAYERLRLAKTSVVVSVADGGRYEYQYDPTRPESRIGRAAVDDTLQRASGRQDVVQTVDREMTERGSRYIDFLVPGLIGMNLMGIGMWGVGLVVVDMRVRNLLKRFLATPMKRHEFLLSVIGGRVLFYIPEMMALLLFANLLFDVPVRGHLLTIALIGLAGTLCFAGLGLLTACRARNIQTASGLMNLVMIPMWLMSGIFFSTERFPDRLQPIIQALPLTQLNDALRAVILEGASLTSQIIPLLILIAWCGGSFFLALRWFRWTE